MTDSNARLRSMIALVVVMLYVAAFGSGCNELPAEPIDIHNQSDQPITIVAITGWSRIHRHVQSRT